MFANIRSYLPVHHAFHTVLQAGEDGRAITRIWMAYPQIRTDRRKVRGGTWLAGGSWLVAEG